MTASSSLLFSAVMEDPFADTMEMASPFAGHVDDFEIDIDIMDDQPGNVDNDLDVQDASPADPTGEAFNDADMMDDVPEVNTTDVPTHEAQQHVQNHDPFYSTQETYESEMVDEDDNAPTADTDAQTAPVEFNTPELINLSEPTEDKSLEQESNQAVESKSEENLGQISRTVQEPETQNEELHPKLLTEKEHDLDAQADTKEDVTEETEQVNPDTTSTEKETEPYSPDQSNNANATEQDHQTVPEMTYPPEEKQAPHTKDIGSFLHSVKVLYQESEISMFPPREGDASETYFLEDEGLAYESVDHLFRHCRTVLGEHASESDSLIFDIESLGIQLSEDNVFNPKVTLSQLVDIYVHLCRNEGSEKPEPLYLTLTTRPNLSAEVSNLLNAVAEGKGISEIQTWDEEYEQQDTEHADDSDYPLPSESHVDKHEDDEHSEAHIGAKPTSTTVQQPDDEDENDEQYHEEVDTTLPNRAMPASSESNGLKEHSQAEADTIENSIDQEEGTLEGHGNTQDDFERHSDSSETVTQAPLVQSEDQQQLGDSETHQQIYDEDQTKFEDYENDFGEEVAENADQDDREEVRVTDTTAHSHVASHLEADTNDDTHANSVEVDNTDATDEVNDEENAAEDYPGENEFEEDAEDAGEHENDQEGDEEYYEDGEYYEEEHQGANEHPEIHRGQVDSSDATHQDGPAESNEAEPGPLDVLGEEVGSLGAAETRERETEALENITGLTAEEPTDDLLGLDEDILAEPEGTGQTTDAEHPAEDGQDDAPKNDIDEIDFEDFNEEGNDPTNTSLQRQNSSTGKRSRASEDEDFEIVEMSTPDAKRTRSS